MPNATNEQIQAVSGEARAICEAIRALRANVKDFRSRFTDTYNALNDNPTWVDTRTDNPPHFLSSNDLLEINTFLFNTDTAWDNDAQMQTILKACKGPLEA